MTGVITATGRVATKNGKKYVLQLCKHWAHKPGTVIDEVLGTISFENGNGVEFDVSSEQLDISIRTAPGGDPNHWKSVVESHVNRFAFREALVFEWTDLDH